MARSRIDGEKHIVEAMIRIYCKGRGHKEALCEECSGLLDYSIARLDSCRFGEDKPFCSKCRVHCYRKDMRGRIREVMRYSGPRMLLHDPLAAIRHFLKLKS